MNVRGELEPGRRAALNCCLPDYDTTTWTGESARPMYLGADSLDHLAGTRRDWEHPLEDPSEGCPAAWQRSRFVASLRRYMRDTDDNGNRVANPVLDRCDDWLVLEAIAYVEGYDRKLRGEYIEAVQRLYDSDR